MKRFRLPLVSQMTAALLTVFVITMFLLGGGLRPEGFGWASNSIGRRDYSRHGIGWYRGEVYFGSFHETWSADLGTPSPPFATTSKIAEGGGIFWSGDIAIFDDTSDITDFGFYNYNRDIGGYVFTSSGFALPACFVTLILGIPALVCIVRLCRNPRNRRVSIRG